jgi:hypothetical protein
MPKHYVQTLRWHKPNRPVMLAAGALRLPPKTALRSYNPAEVFPSSTGKARKVQTLWGEFVELVRQVEADQERPFYPSSRGLSLIVDWSTEYGLLGVLPSKVRKIVLDPVFEEVNVDGVGPSIGMTQRTHWQIAPGVWVTKDSAVELNTPPKRQLPGSPVPKDAWPINTFHSPGVDFYNWEDLAGLESRDLLTLNLFFSPLPAAGELPLPLSKEFWASYQEPVTRWMVSAVAFKNSVMIASQFASSFDQPSRSAMTTGHANDALLILNFLATAIAPVYEFGSRALKQSDSTGSLLSIMAKMFLNDLEAGLRSYQCARCKAIFVSKDSKATYCSNTCRNTAAVGRHRIRTRQRQAKQNATVTRKNAQRNAK